MNTVNFALKEYGVKSWPGPTSNETVLNYFKSIGQGWVQDDDTAWCAAFANFVLLKCGLPHTGKLNARSFLTIGVPTTAPEMGDIVVFWRISPDSPYGHVGFFIKDAGDFVYVLGGNQGGSVSIAKFPKSMLLGYRKMSFS